MDERTKERRRLRKKLLEDMRNSHKYKEHPKTGEHYLKPSHATRSIEHLKGPERDKALTRMKEEAKNYNRRRKKYDKYVPKMRD